MIGGKRYAMAQQWLISWVDDDYFFLCMRSGQSYTCGNVLLYLTPETEGGEASLRSWRKRDVLALYAKYGRFDPGDHFRELPDNINERVDAAIWKAQGGLE